MTGKLCVLAAALALAAPPAQARDLPSGGLTRAEVAQWLQDHGYKAKTHLDTAGNTIVSSASDGVNWDIYFYSCSKAERCASLQYAAGWSGLVLEDGTINTWNAGNRYIRAYVTGKDAVWGEYDIDISPGGTWEQLDQSLDRWGAALPDFKKAIGE